MITSLQIQSLTGKDHDNILRDVRKEIADLELSLQQPTETLLLADSVSSNLRRPNEEVTIKKPEVYGTGNFTATLSSYVDSQGRTQPQYELSDSLAMFLMSGYSKEGKRKLIEHLQVKLDLANATTAIYETAYEAMYAEAKNIVRSVHDYKCDVVSNNGYEERQRSIASMGGAKAVSTKRMKELLAVEDSFNARAERVFDATRKKQIKNLEDIAIGVIAAKER